MKKKLIDLSKKNVIVRKILRSLLRFKRFLNYSYYFYRYSTKKNYIIFESFGGRKYTCSPKFMYEKMIEMEEFKDYIFIWSFTNPENHCVKKNKNLRIVKHNSKEYYKYLSSSKYWIVNSIIDESIRKKKDQVYVQCWHGTPLKRLRCDINVEGSSLNTISEIRKRNDLDAARFDYFLSPSKYSTEKFVSAFNLKKLHEKNIIIEHGYPRNDSLFTYDSKIVDEIKKDIGVPKSKKVIFYLPTFRDNQHTSGLGYTYKTELDLESLKEKFSKDYVLLFSPHYFVANSIDFDKYKGFVYNVADHDDINELFIISDLVITDYSSIFFDFANLKRPMIFYMYDFDEYKGKLRDFYMDLNELPGPITKTQDELEKAIFNVDKDKKKYEKKYEKFNNKFNYLDDKDSSLRVIKAIFNLNNKSIETGK